MPVTGAQPKDAASELRLAPETMMRYELGGLPLEIVRTMDYLDRLQCAADALKQARGEHSSESWAVATATGESARSAAMARYRRALERLRKAEADFLSAARNAPPD